METTLGLLKNAISVMKVIQSSPLEGQQLSKDCKSYIDGFLNLCFSKDGTEAMQRDGATQRLVAAVNELGTSGIVKVNAPVGTNDYHMVSSEAIAHVYQAKRVLNLIGQSTSEVDPKKEQVITQGHEDNDFVKSAEHAVQIHQAIIDHADKSRHVWAVVDLAVGAKATLDAYDPPKPVGGITAEEWVRVQAVAYLPPMRKLGIKIPEAREVPAYEAGADYTVRSLKLVLEHAKTDSRKEVQDLAAKVKDVLDRYERAGSFDIDGVPALNWIRGYGAKFVKDIVMLGIPTPEE